MLAYWGIVLRIISYKTLQEAFEKHADLKKPLDDWYRIAKSSQWLSINDVRKVFPKADPVGNWLFGLCYAMDGGYKGCNRYIERHLAIFVNCF